MRVEDTANSVFIDELRQRETLCSEPTWKECCTAKTLQALQDVIIIIKVRSKDVIIQRKAFPARN